MSGIAGLAYMLHFMQDMCMVVHCLSNIKSHGWMICRVKTMPQGGENVCVNYVFSVVFH